MSRALLVAAALPSDISSRNQSTIRLLSTIPLRNFTLASAEPHPPSTKARNLIPRGNLDPNAPGKSSGRDASLGSRGLKAYVVGEDPASGTRTPNRSTDRNSIPTTSIVTHNY